MGWFVCCSGCCFICSVALLLSLLYCLLYDLTAGRLIVLSVLFWFCYDLFGYRLLVWCFVCCCCLVLGCVFCFFCVCLVFCGISDCVLCDFDLVRDVRLFSCYYWFGVCCCSLRYVVDDVVLFDSDWLLVLLVCLITCYGLFAMVCLV